MPKRATLVDRTLALGGRRLVSGVHPPGLLRSCGFTASAENMKVKHENRDIVETIEKSDS
jgi:hypothetical protein